MDSPADFKTYSHARLLPNGNLDERLINFVKPLFVRGDYDTAVFRAYKEVETRTRSYAGYSDDKIGRELLMDKALNEHHGPLRNMDASVAENQSLKYLFSGSYGMFRNPASHRDIDYSSPSEVAEIILLANYLLRSLDKHKR